MSNTNITKLRIFFKRPDGTETCFKINHQDLGAGFLQVASALFEKGIHVDRSEFITDNEVEAGEIFVEGENISSELQAILGQ